MQSFRGIDIFKVGEGLLRDQSLSMYPTKAWGHKKRMSEFSSRSSYYFGIVLNGSPKLHQQADGAVFHLVPKMYFACSGPITIEGESDVLVIERLGYRGLCTIGGPAEQMGRLTYIDSCTSTLLIPPARLGDPCFNLLHFPKKIKQTLHIHPTVRVGCVLSGAGSAVSAEGHEKALAPGDCFVIDQNVPHLFMTRDEELLITAFHPDTDWGPTDQAHPMLNRTYIQK